MPEVVLLVARVTCSPWSTPARNQGSKASDRVRTSSRWRPSTAPPVSITLATGRAATRGSTTSPSRSSVSRSESGSSRRPEGSRPWATSVAVRTARAWGFASEPAPPSLTASVDGPWASVTVPARARSPSDTHRKVGGDATLSVAGSAPSRSPSTARKESHVEPRSRAGDRSGCRWRRGLRSTFSSSRSMVGTRRATLASAASGSVSASSTTGRRSDQEMRRPWAWLETSTMITPSPGSALASPRRSQSIGAMPVSGSAPEGRATTARRRP